MNIVFIDTLGLSYWGETPRLRGLGGSESATIYMAEELVKLGFSVKIYNDCESDQAQAGNYNGVEYIPLRTIEDFTGDCDVLIGVRSLAAFASPDMPLMGENVHYDFSKVYNAARLKVLIMHDTFCGGSDEVLEPFVVQGRVDEIWTLSDFHTSYVTNCDHGARRNFEVLKDHIWQTRNGVNLDNSYTDISKKDPNLFVYNASVTKGMVPLVTKIWPEVVKQIPQAKLKIIGGYYQFRDGIQDEQEHKFWELTKLQNSNIEFTGIITQAEIATILKEASYMLYPAAFPETFGISTLESLAHNTPIITCQFGALEETAIDIASYKIPYAIEPNGLFPNINPDTQNDNFITETINAYNDIYLHQQKMWACNQVKDICTWDTVALQWKQHIYDVLGEYLPKNEYRKVSDINYKVAKTFGRRFSSPEYLNPPKKPEQRIVVISPVYNAEKYIETHIKSVMAQDYDNYEHVIINDGSCDKTYDIIQKYIGKVTLINNTTRNGSAIENQLYAMRLYCSDDDIVVLLDGDDSLVNNPNIFNKINDLYHDGFEFTYGSMWSMADNIPLIAQDYPLDIIDYREVQFNWGIPYTHLRTFRKKYINNIPSSKFKDSDGKWFKAGGDNAMFYNVIEQVDPACVKAVPDILVNYNDLNDLNDYKVNPTEQNENANLIQKKNETSMKKILIAIPTAKYIEPETFKSIYDLEVPEGYETEFRYTWGYNVAQVRNLISDWVIKGYDYLFSVDSDISFPPDTLKKLLEADKDLISGVYRQRLEPQILEIYDWNGNNATYSELASMQNDVGEIAGCGFGCVLVKREVLVNVGYPQFEYHNALDHKDTISEDTDFCQKAMSKGHSLWVDRTILCNHIGSSTFTVDTSPEWDPYVESKPDNTEDILRNLGNQDMLPKAHKDFLVYLKDQGIEPKLIYDIGSCVLHWTKEAEKVWPNANIRLFDAMDELRPLYEESGHDYFIGALSDSIKEVEFYQNTTHPGGNSYYRENEEFSPDAKFLFPKGSAITKQAVYLDMFNRSPDLIKIDVQGAELDILRGARETLKNCQNIIIEIQHVQYNEGAPQKEDVVGYLESLGFTNMGTVCECDMDADYWFTRKD